MLEHKLCAKRTRALVDYHLSIAVFYEDSCNFSADEPSLSLCLKLCMCAVVKWLCIVTKLLAVPEFPVGNAQGYGQSLFPWL